jgi:proteasome lid subunit RPN8/RPN11
MLRTRPFPAAHRKPPPQPSMLVAVKTFAARDGDDLVQVTKGERIVPNHPLVTRYPDAFAPEGTAGAREAHRTTTSTHDPRDARTQRSPATDTLPRPSWSLGAPPLHCRADVELRDGTSPVTVSVTDSAHDEIDAWISATPAGYETGGLLIGRPDGDTVRIFEAWGPGPSAEHGRNSLCIHYGLHLDRARRLRDSTNHDESVVVGVWHTHPSTTDRPSPGDLGVFGELLQRANEEVAFVPAFVGLIVANPNRERHDRPPPTAWVVRHAGLNHDLICERAA